MPGMQGFSSKSYAIECTFGNMEVAEQALLRPHGHKPEKIASREVQSYRSSLLKRYPFLGSDV